MKSEASLPCPACDRTVREIRDVPRLSVERVLCLELRHKLRARDLPSGQPRGTQTPLERRLADWGVYSRELDRYDKEREEMRSVGRQVAASDAVRGYMADLRALSGRTVASSALLPAWQPKAVRYGDAEPIPGAPFQESTPQHSASRWVVYLETRWHAVGLGARVDVSLVCQGRQMGMHAGTLARVWGRGHWNPCGQEVGA